MKKSISICYYLFGWYLIFPLLQKGGEIQIFAENYKKSSTGNGNESNQYWSQVNKRSKSPIYDKYEVKIFLVR